MASVTSAGALCSLAIAAPTVSFSKSSSVRIGAPSAVRPLTVINRRCPLVMRAGSPNSGDLQSQVERSITEAQEVCKGNETSEECVVAWGDVEELSAANADAKRKAKANSDPLEVYCADNPETDECRVYED